MDTRLYVNFWSKMPPKHFGLQADGIFLGRGTVKVFGVLRN